MRMNRIDYACDESYKYGYDDGYDDGYVAARDQYLEERKQLHECLRAILGYGEAPEHDMNDGRAENRREERTAPSADGIRA